MRSLVTMAAVSLVTRTCIVNVRRVKGVCARACTRQLVTLITFPFLRQGLGAFSGSKSSEEGSTGSADTSSSSKYSLRKTRRRQTRPELDNGVCVGEGVFNVYEYLYPLSLKMMMTFLLAQREDVNHDGMVAVISSKIDHYEPEQGHMPRDQRIPRCPHLTDKLH